MSYANDRRWSDQYIPTIKNIVGPLLLEPSSFEVDTKQAADFVVLTGRNVSIAARVRRPGYADRYPYDFTIRSARESGAETELAKMMAGWGDWMLYAHAVSLVGDQFSRWMVIDLHEWRKALLREGFSKSWKRLSTRIDNNDGTHGLAFDIRNFPEALIAASFSLPAVVEPEFA